MAQGTRHIRKEVLEDKAGLHVVINAPFAFALGADFKTNRALLHELSEKGFDFRISLEGAIPDLQYFHDIPMSFRLPNDQTTWKCSIDIERIYAFDEHDRPVYGMEVKFKDLTKEQKQQLQAYIKARINATQRSAKGPSAPSAS
jgi:hypothetical protein